MATTPAVTLKGRFPSGTEVLLYERTGDAVNTAGPVVARAKTNSDSETHFSGLQDGHRYFAVGKVDDAQVAVAVTAKNAPAGKVQPQTEIISPSSGVDGGAPVIEESEPPKGAVEAHPHPNQAQAGKGVQQMSDTPYGQATPVDPSRPLPGTKQEDVPEGTPQRSDTPLGEATVVATDEVQPGLAQADVPKGTQQRSATPYGEATIIPKGDPIEIERKRYEAPGVDVPEVTKDRQPAPRSPKAKTRQRKAQTKKGARAASKASAPRKR